MEVTKLGVKYSVRVIKAVDKQKVKKDVIRSIEGSPELRKEMRRVFQMANRRIQNIESAGLISPAVMALEKEGVKGYSKFTVKGFGNTGDDWRQLKKEYAKAISFLQKPTSTAEGARAFEEYTKARVNIDPKLYNALREKIIYHAEEYEQRLRNARPYADMIEQIYDEASTSASNQMENEAEQIQNALQNSIDNTAEGIASNIDANIKNLLSGFRIK